MNELQLESRAEWRAWLAQNHAQSDGVWLITFKKHTGSKHLPYDDMVEEALCFGWIDATARKVDEDRSMRWVTPRKPGSGWSKLNKERIENLIAAGLMTSAGLGKIEAAKQDGSWYALDAVEQLEISPDLETALAAYEVARQHFDAFPRSVKRAILEWIASAKKPETRAQRIAETARLAQDNIRANQWQP
ncbi:MAG: YdeI/OmpD-associated family protein [Anaerolineae bacterium]|nr:YdeI/OmpD-associated family protein [Anaerolineae bacterium]